MPWIYIFILVLILLVAYQAYAAKNHLEPNTPFYSGNYAAGDPDHPIESLTVISYNIGYALNIDRAIEEIKQIRSQRGLDILLLQEMDEVGMEEISTVLQLNYVYYPAAIESTYRKNFGNAVLSPWPISASQKLILPHISFSNRMKRAATRAAIQIRGEELIAYSIHTEPVFILPKYKEDQCLAILHELDPRAGRVVIGGDFNSFTEKGIEKLERRYQIMGFERASKGSGHTFVRWGLKMSPDHIFTKGFAVKEKGKLSEASASDHLPIWVTILPE
jgi:endonuclease/exonuclease/phosphatase family metal-dependent hydrolase